MNNSSRLQESSLQGDLGVEQNALPEDSGLRPTRKITRPEHTFIHAVINGKSLTDAYKRAYPGTAQKTASSKGSKLAKKPHIAARMEELRANMAARIGEETIEEMTEHFMSLHDKRMLLTNMMKGHVKVNKHFNRKEGVETIKDELNPSIVLRAIELDTKLENGWYDRKKPPEIKLPANTASTPAAAKKEKEPPRPNRFKVYIDGESADLKNRHVLTKEEEKALMQLSLTNKNIARGTPSLTPTQIEQGLRRVTHPRTGRRFIVRDTVQDDELEELWTEVDSFYTEPYDDEELANISKNSKVITGLLNYEYQLCMYGTLANRENYAEKEKEEAYEQNIEQQETSQSSLALSTATQQSSHSFSESHTGSHTHSALGTTAQQPYRPVKEIWKEYWDAWTRTGSQKDHAAYIEALTMYKALLSPNMKPKAEKSGVWEFHPNDITLMRKKAS